jgi:hypothetical protein
MDRGNYPFMTSGAKFATQPDKEIQGHQVLHMVLQKGLPRGEWRFSRAYPMRFHSGLRHVNAQLAQLADDSRCTPGRIGLPHCADELADLLGNRRTAGRAWLAQPLPVVAKAPALPGDHGARLDECQGIAPAWPEPS